MKVAINKEKKYLIKDPSKDYHSEFGYIKADDISKGGECETNKGKLFSVFDASFVDKYEKIKRRAQIITLKDAGVIAAETGLGRDSMVIEAGSGSGAFSCFTANICKKVVSYDVREDHQEVAKKNAEMLGFNNITFKIKDIREGFDERTADVVLLDMPDPWNAIESSSKALKQGGFLVVYSPTVPQVFDTVEKVSSDFFKEFVFVKTVENIQRPWEMSGRKVRPQSSYINHTAFLTFFRRI